MRDAVHQRTGTPVRVGHLTVRENRGLADGRVLRLRAIVVPARIPATPPRAPLFILAGGPGQAATTLLNGAIGRPYALGRDLVFLDQRGTADEHRLSLPLAKSDEIEADPLGSLFPPERVAAARVELGKRADLTQYSTPIAMDDLDELRAALGYERIDLMGTSYGTRAALVYMRRHTLRVRSAVLLGSMPLTVKNPSTHARELDAAIDRLIAECAGDPDCARAFGDLDAKLKEVLERLADQPAKLTIPHPETGEASPIAFTREHFLEALRIQLYGSDFGRRLPLTIDRAHRGDLAPLAEVGALARSRIATLIPIGMLLCVTCSEDIDRTGEEELARLTAGTRMGAARFQRQRQACVGWPRSVLPKNYGEAVSVATPTLILTGDADPVTGPQLGAETARSLPNSIHVVFPGGHSPGGAQWNCISKLIQGFLDSGSGDELDTSCVERIDSGSFALPSREQDDR